MQADPGYALRWHRIKAEAGRTPELERVVAGLQDLGWSRQRIVDAIEADVDGIVALIQRRRALLRRS